MVFLLAVLLLFVFSAGSFALSVGYVDTEKVLAQYKGTADAKEKMQKELDKQQKSLEKEKDEILKSKADLDKKSSILDKSKVAEQEKDIQDKAEKLQAKALEMQQKLVSQEKEIMSNIVEEIRAIVQKIAKEKNYDLVFDKGVMLFGGEDITYLVIKKMNE
jgi:outer membrane protein